jgi:hypothetical protein
MTRIEAFLYSWSTMSYLVTDWAEHPVLLACSMATLLLFLGIFLFLGDYLAIRVSVPEAPIKSVLAVSFLSSFLPMLFLALFEVCRIALQAPYRGP